MAKTQEALQAEIEICLRGLKIGFALATETSPGELIEVELGQHIDAATIAAAAVLALPAFFNPV